MKSALKRVSSLFLSLVLVFSFTVIAFSSVQVPIVFNADGKNTSRAADTIIIYNQEGTTGTNRYGYEVCVDKTGKIISMGGNNSPIPEDGFVLSGHDKGAAFLKANVEIGLYASFCPLTLEVTIDTCRHLPFGSKTVSLSAINSYRLSNYLVVYTPDFKYATTNTNRYGCEAVVQNGIVTSVGGNNNTIPENGFVISAVENALGWFYDAVSVGVSASFSSEDKTLSVSYDINSVFYADRYKLSELYNKLPNAEDAAAALAAYDNALTLLNSSIADFEANGDAFKYLDFSAVFSHTIDRAVALCYYSKNKEIRSVWYSAGNSTREKVEQTVEDIYNLGINTISLCGFESGYFRTALPENSPFTSSIQLGHEDVVSYYIDACHKRNMKFSLWMPVFYAGYTSSTYLVTKNLPELQVLSQNGTPDTLSGYVFLDPSNKDVTDLLLNTYEYILKNYDIDTFELDYIRYQGTSSSLDFGYKTTAEREFTEQYGEVPRYDRTWALWKDWCLFRASYITNFVRDMHELIKEVKPDTFLSADVFGSNDTQYSIYQDWQTWVKNGYIDIVIPMLYGVNTFNAGINIFSEAVKNTDCVLVTGLSVSGDDSPPEIIAQQIITAREKGAGGVSLFAFPGAYKCANPRISQGVFRTVAEYPVCFYNVVFYDAQSNVISTQIVKSGASAVSPDFPQNNNPHAMFTGWSENISAVNSNLTVNPVYTYSGCVDANSDKICDICGLALNKDEPETQVDEKCSCICHKTGFMSYIYKIICFFWRLFGINKYCSCNEAHY